MVIGFVTGLLGSLLGIGGGVVLVPALFFVFHLKIQQAIAISVVMVVANSVFVAAQKLNAGLVCLRLATLLELPALLLGGLGAALTLSLDTDVLLRIFAIFLVCIAALMAWKRQEFDITPNDAIPASHEGSRIRIIESYYEPISGQHIDYVVRKPLVLMLVAGTTGVLAGLLGIGGGVLMVPALTLLGRLPIKIAIGTSAYVMGLGAAGSAGVFLTNGFVMASTVLWCLAGLIPGASFGHWLSQRMDAAILKWLFVILLLGVAIKMWSTHG